MKKLIYLLALCLCLNGTLALASEAENDALTGAEGGAAVEASGAEAETADTESGGEIAVATADAAGAGESAPDANGGNGGDANVASNTETGADGESADGSAGAGETPAGNDVPSGDNASSGSDAPTGTDAPASGDANPTDSDPASGDAAPTDPAPASGDADPADDEGTEPEAQDEVPEDAEAWFERDGAKVGGKLQEIVPQLTGGETLNLVTKNLKGVVRVEGAPLRKLADVLLKLDPEDKTKAVRVSRSDPAGAEAPETIELKALADCGEDEKGELFFWIEAVKDETPAPEPTEAPAPVLTVSAENFAPAEWRAELPVFTLSGIPEGGAYSYAAVVYDERIVPLSADTYVPEAEGKYNVRFAMLDAIGDIVSASETYPLWLDVTAPEPVTVEADEAQSYTLHITATDGLSGVTGVSLDGGATWEPLSNGETYTFTGTAAATFSAGAIQVIDAAGNVWRSEKEYQLEAVTPEPGGGGGGGGGASGDGKPAKTHASGDGESGPAYETLALELPEAPMTQLTVGGEAMDLTLVLEAAQADGAPVGEAQPFTARLGSWCPTPPGEDAHENIYADAAKPAQDTLILTAALDADLGDEFAYTWRFNGEVYRMLANSGVKYVALQVGDDVAAFSTEGFTGGTKYTELKMLGVSTRKFDYTLTMKVNLDPGFVSAMSDSDFSRNCDLSIRAEVENMAYELSGSTNSIMYFYDVYLGPEDMLNQPFGQYSVEG